MIRGIIIEFDFTVNTDSVTRVRKSSHYSVQVEAPVVVHMTIEMERPNAQFAFIPGEECEPSLQGNSKSRLNSGYVVAAQIKRLQVAPNSE